MALTTDEHALILQALLPPGAAWTREQTATLTKVLLAWADGFALIDQMWEDLADEADPRTAWEMLSEWEALCGLPGQCFGSAETISQRRAAVISHLTLLGDQSPAFLTELAATNGYDVEIIDGYGPFRAGDRTGQPLRGAAWAFVFTVLAPAQSVHWFTAGCAAGEPLAWWGNEPLECIINRFKPAHTVALFAHQEE
ncbi:YmfQ family protein [Desulfarculus baarsii]